VAALLESEPGFDADAARVEALGRARELVAEGYLVVTD